MHNRQWLWAVILILLLSACGGQVAERNNAGNSDYAHEDYDAAVLAYEQAQVNDPDRSESYYNMASAMMGMDDLQQAVAALEQALRTADDDLAARAYYNLGNVYFEMGQFTDAFDAYQQALLLRPDDEDARHNLELTLRRIIPPTPTAQEQQIEPSQGQTDPETTPTNQPSGFDGPTPTPPQEEGPPDLTATPQEGSGNGGQEDSSTPIPQSQGSLTVEQAEQLLDTVQQDQHSLREFMREEATEGEPAERDW